MQRPGARLLQSIGASRPAKDTSGNPNGLKGTRQRPAGNRLLPGLRYVACQLKPLTQSFASVPPVSQTSNPKLAAVQILPAGR